MLHTWEIGYFSIMCLITEAYSVELRGFGGAVFRIVDGSR